MGKAIFKGLVTFSGKVAGLVYALQPDGSVNVRRLPTTTGTRSPGQLKQQDQVSEAAAYWRKVKEDPVKMAIYRALPKVHGLGPRHFAARDFAHPPVVEDIDVSGFFGRMGDPIRIRATDDTAVMKVTVQILDLANTVLEEGSARREATSDDWIYLGNQAFTSGQALAIRATATDYPDHSATKSCLAYAR